MHHQALTKLEETLLHEEKTIIKMAELFLSLMLWLMIRRHLYDSDIPGKNYNK